MRKNKKVRKNKALTLFLIIVLFLCASAYTKQSPNSNSNIKPSIKTVRSIISENNKEDVENFIFQHQPVINAEAAITLDVTNNRILYKKNVHERMRPASTTKLLTAQLFAEYFSPKNNIRYTRGCKDQPEYKLDLKIGDTISAKDAMDAVMLYSANDIAEAMGENSKKSVEAFVKDMNRKVDSLGLNESHFMNPIGLDDDEHYTTAYDLVNIAKEVYKYPWIMDSMKKKTSTINTSKGKITLENRNKLLGINGCVGGKTGYTSQAGKCLVCFYEINNRKMIGVVLNSKDDDTVIKDMEKIIKWSYKK